MLYIRNHSKCHMFSYSKFNIHQQSHQITKCDTKVNRRTKIPIIDPLSTNHYYNFPECTVLENPQIKENGGKESPTMWKKIRKLLKKKLTSTTTPSNAGWDIFFIFPWLSFGALSARWRPRDWFDVLSTRLLSTELFDALWLISRADEMSTFDALPPVPWCLGSW